MVSLRVGVDLDGCLFDFGASLKRYIASIGMSEVYRMDEEQPQVWDFYRAWGMTDDGFRELCNRGVCKGYVFAGPALPNSRESIQRIKDLGHTVHIVTNRHYGCDPEESHEATRRWLDEHEIPYDTLDFSADKTTVPTDAFVEDNLKNYDALEAAGTVAFLINRPWNIEDDQRLRISGIEDFATAIETLTRYAKHHPIFS